MRDRDFRELKRNVKILDETLSDAENNVYRKWFVVRSGLDEILQSGEPPLIRKNVRKPAVLIATPEVTSLKNNMGNLAEIVKTGDGGGLADISSAVIAELDNQGVDVHVAVPNYKHLFERHSNITNVEVRKLKRRISDYKNRVHLISDGLFENTKKVYGDNSGWIKSTDLRKANAFQRGIIYELFDELKEEYDDVLVHCNDWMTGLLPSAAKNFGIPSLMTFHNVFTHLQELEELYGQGIDVRPFAENLYYREHPDFYISYEKHFRFNHVDFMASGLFAADKINTVSDKFLKEIVNDYFLEDGIIPNHLREIIKRRYFNGDASGILNSPRIFSDSRIDPELFDNKGDINYNYSKENILEGKRLNKKRFQKEMGLEVDSDVVLFYWPSRLNEIQKGAHLLIDSIPKMIGNYRDIGVKIQFGFVSSGEKHLELQLKKYQREFHGSVAYKSFDRRLSQIGKAASDFIVMPSLYEPCGIPQVEGPRYGTLPIVRETGGLADTVEHLSDDGLKGNGFTFMHFTKEDLREAMDEAIRFYRKGDEFRIGVLQRAMGDSFERFNIRNTAKEYIALYEEILGKSVI